MQYRLVIFDLDGTILDTLEDLAISVNAALSMHHMPERTIDEVRSFVGNGIRKLIARAVPPQTPSGEADGVFVDFKTHYDAHCREHTIPYPGIPELLQSLRSAGIQTAVVSNKADNAVQKLCSEIFPGLFDAVAGEREGIPRKPAPDAVNAVLELLSVPKEEAVYIGDSDVDIRTAENAGIPCISVDWGFRPAEFLRENGATEIISTADALRVRLLQE